MKAKNIRKGDLQPELQCAYTYDVYLDDGETLMFSDQQVVCSPSSAEQLIREHLTQVESAYQASLVLPDEIS